MRDSDSLQSQLDKDEAALAATHGRIEKGHRLIEGLQAQIAATQGKIEATEHKIEELREHAATIEKRIALLREYMAMVDTADESAVPTVDTPPPIPTQAAEPPPTNEGVDDIVPSLEGEGQQEIDDLAFVDSLPGATADPTKAAAAGPTTFETIDEETLTHELLPRTQTFEEELLLVMAYHRKALPPKDVARLFRRLDYAPKQSATETVVKAQVESDHHFFEYAADNRIALTREGREEAQRLLEQLL